MESPPVTPDESPVVAHRSSSFSVLRSLAKNSSKGSRQSLTSIDKSPGPPTKSSSMNNTGQRGQGGKKKVMMVVFLAVVSISTVFVIKDLRFSNSPPPLPELSEPRADAEDLDQSSRLLGATGGAGGAGTGSGSADGDKGLSEEPVINRSEPVEVETEARVFDLHEKKKKSKRKKGKKEKKAGGGGKKNRKGLQRQRQRELPPPSPPPPPAPVNPLDPELSPSHPCANFTLPPPPADKKRTGPRPCPVCYLPLPDAVAMQPPRDHMREPILRHLSYVSEDDASERAARRAGHRPRFNGHQSLQQREDSFIVQESMRVHCGFVWGGKPTAGTGFDVSDDDRRFMDRCYDIVVVSAIFGAYDVVQQPRDISDEARQRLCFVMFVDQTTYDEFVRDGTLKQPRTRRVGLWRLVVVSNPPYRDPRRTGKIPKLLIHRLFPNAQFSIWVDAKLELVQDPYRILERFLWRGNFSWAISKHYKRFDVFVEAEANKAAGKYRNASIDEQMEVYRADGMTPFDEDAKWPIISDVPEGCVIIREHTPVSNLMACLWFNEVDRFTSRDQLSFGYTRDKIRRSVPAWRLNMFLDCQRRNFVVQGYHKDVLIQKLNATDQSGSGSILDSQQHTSSPQQDVDHSQQQEQLESDEDQARAANEQDDDDVEGGRSARRRSRMLAEHGGGELLQSSLLSWSGTRGRGLGLRRMQYDPRSGS